MNPLHAQLFIYPPPLPLIFLRGDEERKHVNAKKIRARKIPRLGRFWLDNLILNNF